MTPNELCELLDSTNVVHKSCPAFNAPWIQNGEWSTRMKDFDQISDKRLKCAKHGCKYLLRVFWKHGEELFEVEKCYQALSDAKRVALAIDSPEFANIIIDLIVVDHWGETKAVESLHYVDENGELKSLFTA